MVRASMSWLRTDVWRCLNSSWRWSVAHLSLGRWTTEDVAVGFKELRTTGGQLWDAAIHMAEFLGEMREVLDLSRPGMRILELGSGTGWLGLVCARNLPGALCASAAMWWAALGIAFTAAAVVFTLWGVGLVRSDLDAVQGGSVSLDPRKIEWIYTEFKARRQTSNEFLEGTPCEVEVYM